MVAFYMHLATPTNFLRIIVYSLLPSCWTGAAINNLNNSKRQWVWSTHVCANFRQQFFGESGTKANGRIAENSQRVEVHDTFIFYNLCTFRDSKIDMKLFSMLIILIGTIAHLSSTGIGCAKWKKGERRKFFFLQVHIRIP